MTSQTLHDVDVQNLIEHLQPHDFNAWVTSSGRKPKDYANLIQLARALGKAGVLEDDSPLSEFSKYTFWQDLASTFPRILGYIMLLPTADERKRVRDSLQGLEVFIYKQTSAQSYPDPHPHPDPDPHPHPDPHLHPHLRPRSISMSASLKSP